MAERKPGPVKPPVIDLTARPADAAKPPAGPQEPSKPTEKPQAIEAPKTERSETPAEARVEPAAAAAGPRDPGTADSPRPAAGAFPNPSAASAKGARPEVSQTAAPRPAPPPRYWPIALGAGICGAIIAVAVCYGLAEEGLWPAGQQAAGLDQRLTRLEQADSAAGAERTRLESRQAGLAARLSAADSALATTQASLKALQAPSADLADLQNQVKTLSSRLDAVAAGASSADAGALAAKLTTAQQDLAGLTQKVDALANRADGATTDLRSGLASANSRIDKIAAAPSPQQIAAAMQLPILISAIDADFSAGRPYADDIKALRAAVPGAAIPATIAGAAPTGLPAAADVAAGFEAKMPDMIAAEPGSAADSWQGQVADWARGMLALRRQGVEQGNGPDAMLSQLEAAVGRHDFASAAALLGKLPQPMQQAAGHVGGQIRTLADADAFIGQLRQKALQPLAGAKS